MMVFAGQLGKSSLIAGSVLLHVLGKNTPHFRFLLHSVAYNIIDTDSKFGQACLQKAWADVQWTSRSVPPKSGYLTVVKRGETWGKSHLAVVCGTTFGDKKSM